MIFMRTAGIISEYNPFHRGHAWQIGELRRRLGAETAVVCAMSGSFVQRGDFAVMRTHARAEAAVRGGADLVLELPLPWAIASAEGFAAGGVGVLAATGAVDTLVFGSECGDTETLKAVAAASPLPRICVRAYRRASPSPQRAKPPHASCSVRRPPSSRSRTTFWAWNTAKLSRVKML